MFLNAAAVGETTLSAHDLLAVLLDIEKRFGRERPYPGAARTLDLDLILYDGDIIDVRRSHRAASAFQGAALRA